MTVTARELRLLAAEVLSALRHGETVTITYRGKPVGIIQPVGTEKEAAFRPVGFGLWQRDGRVRDVDGRMEKLRSPRYAR